MRRLWPGNLAGQLVLIVLLALAAGQLLSVLILADERRAAVRVASREQVLARAAGLVRLVEETPPALHQRILAASASRTMSTSWPARLPGHSRLTPRGPRP